MGFFFPNPADLAREITQGERIDALLEMLSRERERAAIAEGRADELHAALIVAQNNFEWARVRLNQVEAERAQYLSALIRLPLVPVAFERAESAPEPQAAPAGAGIPNTFNFDFEDVGDATAKTLGIEHDEGGTLRYRN